MKEKIACLALGSLILAGCSDAEREAPRPEEASVSTNAVASYEMLLPDAVLVKVGEHRLTKRDLEDEVEFKTALLKHRRPRCSEKRLGAFREKQRQQAADSFYQNRLLLDEAKRCGDVQADAEMRRKQEEKYLRTFGVGKETYGDLVAAVGETGFGPRFQARFEDDLRVEAYLWANFSNELTVTEQEVKSGIERMARYNANAVKTNEVAWARASNVVARVKGGEDFAKLAAIYDESDEGKPGDFECECDQNDYADNADLWAEINALPDGASTGIIKTDVGLEIIRLVRRLKPEESASGERALKLQRIYIRLPLVYPEHTMETLRPIYEAEKRQDVLMPLFKRLSEANPPEFPCGARLVPRPRRFKIPNTKTEQK